MADYARLMQRADEAVKAAGHQGVGISMPTFGTLVATHPVEATRAAAQAVLDALDKSDRVPKSYAALYQDITVLNLTQAQSLKALRALLAYVARNDPDVFKKLEPILPELAAIVGDEPAA
jgi:hypothetical protein